MRMMKLAFTNFKGSAKSVLSLVFSLAFTVMIFLNFQNIVFSDAFQMLGEHNKEFINIVTEVFSFLLGVFLFFFIWYATNVFLTRRKKEIGIYVFMGLCNEKIGKMYMIESAMIGIAALVLGLVLGVLTTGLFQMILQALSDLAVDVRFSVTLTPILLTAGIYLAVYLLFVVKGYVNIVRSSVLDMISAAKQNEYVKQNPIVLVFKAILGCIVLGTGFYMALKDAGMEMLGNVFGAVVLVTIGVYLLFGGLLPLIFQSLVKRKGFLYQKQRTLWMNQMIFRMKKNYRTYAMVCVLALSAVTALAAGFAMKSRYENMVLYDNTYTFQLLSNQTDLDEKATAVIEAESGIACSTQLPLVSLAVYGEDGSQAGSYQVVAYSDLKQLASKAGMEFTLEEPGADEVILLGNLPLFSLITEFEEVTENIGGKDYHRVAISRIPYLGYLQNMMNFYVVNDAEYERLLPLGEQLYTYNYRITDPADFSSVRDALGALTSSTEENYTARIAVDPNNSDMDWIKVMYSLCIFVFLVFEMASGCIMFMKVYNDAFEEKGRYAVLMKLGFGERTLRKSVVCELGAAYSAPFLVMAFSAYFSVHALGKMMFTNLLSVNVASVLVVFVIFFVCYLLSVGVYRKNVGI